MKVETMKARLFGPLLALLVVSVAVQADDTRVAMIDGQHTEASHDDVSLDVAMELAYDEAALRDALQAEVRSDLERSLDGAREATGDADREEAPAEEEG